MAFRQYRYFFLVVHLTVLRERENNHNNIFLDVFVLNNSHYSLIVSNIGLVFCMFVKDMSHQSRHQAWTKDLNTLFLTRAGTFKQSMAARNRGGKGLSFQPARAGIFKKSMGARHRVGIGLSYWPAMLHRLAELMPWHQFLGPIHV